MEVIFAVLSAVVVALVAALVYEARARRTDRRTTAQEIKTLRAAAEQAEQTRADLSELRSAIGFEDGGSAADLIGDMRTIKGLLKKMTDRSAAARERAAGALARSAAADAVTEKLSDAQVLDIVRSAIEGNRVDLYLQPIVTLPQRKVRFYEAFGRIRTERALSSCPSSTVAWRWSAGFCRPSRTSCCSVACNRCAAPGATSSRSVSSTISPARRSRTPSSSRSSSISSSATRTSPAVSSSSCLRPTPRTRA
ncbi:MAG: EAL domain-containing protein [Alphaproteobacteria bacterium]|nr:EAL domain-containing protein [Alphaproteobacteria bacterium]